MLSLLLLMTLAQDVPLAAVTVPDAELARQRGGFLLPNGIDVALTVQTQTSVDGMVVLRSVFRADQGTPTLAVYAPKAGETVASEGTQTTGTGSPAMPTISFDGRGGVQILPGIAARTVAVGVTTASDLPPGLEQVAAGTSLSTAAGTVSQGGTGGLQTAELRAADLSITHLAGTAFGSAIANSGNDRAIDTQTSVGIELRNLGSTVMAGAMLRAEDVALSALRGRQ
ncbi:hypothetical protein [Sphingomonas sp. RS2018]